MSASLKEVMRARRKAAHAAIVDFQRAFAATYPAGKRIAWKHGPHMQHGIVEANSVSEWSDSMGAVLVATNERTGKRVRVTLYSIEQGEGYDRFA